MNERRTSMAAAIVFGGLGACWWATACGVAAAADWPTWRANAARQAVTAVAPPAELHRQWSAKLPPAAPAWPEDPRLQFDAHPEPIVAGERLFVGSSSTDELLALDVRTGRTVWRFPAGGPIRFAPVAAEGRVYFGADDGCLYCVDAADGRPIWKYDAAPNARKVLGSERIVSVWPVRGGPVLVDGRLYCTIGVWPFEGTFLVAVNAQTGRPAPDSDGGPAERRPLDDRTPQGYLVADGRRLFLPCGRSTVAVFDRATGEFAPHSYRTSEVTTYHAAASGRWLLHGALAYDLESKTQADVAPRHAVLTADSAYFGDKQSVRALDLANPQLREAKDRTGKVVRRLAIPVRWSWDWYGAQGGEPNAAPAARPQVVKKGQPTPPAPPPVVVDLLAGRRLYARRASTVFALQLSDDPSTPPALQWRTELDETPVATIAGADRLFVVTREGSLHCFGGDPVDSPERLDLTPPSADRAPDAADRSANAASLAARADALLRRTGVGGGYALLLGAGSLEWIEPLAERAELRAVGVAADADRIATVRRRLQAARLPAMQASLVQADPLRSGLPPYLADLAVADEPTGRAVIGDPERLSELYRLLRPYGGAVWLPSTDADHDRLRETLAKAKPAGAELDRFDGGSLLTRTGALPGSADWTHEYGDPANTLMSRDELVRAPLGVLWFGGPAASGDLFYDRHFWGPSLTVVEGRMLVQGPKKLTAIDIYTGRLLWSKSLPHSDANNPGRRGQDFENVLSGYNFVAQADAIHVVQGPELVTLDPRSGDERSRWRLPDDDLWGAIRVQGEVLVAEAFPATGPHAQKPRRLVAVDRRSGKPLWSREANLSFPVVAVGPQTVYCFDADIEHFYLDWKRKGLVPKANEIRQLKAFDLQTGEPRWERSTDQVVTWLGYSAEHDVLVASNKEQIGARRGRDGEELWQKKAEGLGFKGHPESLWDKLILWKDRILDQRGPGLSYDLRTGESIRRAHPTTGEPVDWEFTKSGHHCNYAIANPHLMTFRAGAAGFCDLDSGNTARLEGFRSGCRNSLIPAGGVLSAPNFAHGCVCGYSLFTSLALVHVPDNELWGYNPLKSGEKPIKRIGINLGGRGDRMSARGTLWLEHPSVNGTLLGASVALEGADRKMFQLHSSYVQGDADSLPWVAASGVEGATSVIVRWNRPAPEERRDYRVRLYFAEPDALAVDGRRKFDVALQGKTVLQAFDVRAAAGGAQRALVREFGPIEADGELRIDLSATVGRTLLSGVEIEAIEPASPTGSK